MKANLELTKLEWFAAKALQGILSSVDGLEPKYRNPQHISEMAFDMAQAMLEESRKRKI